MQTLRGQGKTEGRDLLAGTLASCPCDKRTGEVRGVLVIWIRPKEQRGTAKKNRIEKSIH